MSPQTPKRSSTLKYQSQSQYCFSSCLVKENIEASYHASSSSVDAHRSFIDSSSGSSRPQSQSPRQSRFVEDLPSEQSPAAATVGRPKRVRCRYHGINNCYNCRARRALDSHLNDWEEAMVEWREERRTKLSQLQRRWEELEKQFTSIGKQSRILHLKGPFGGHRIYDVMDISAALDEKWIELTSE